ncbi:MAG: extracellular solute-binding protein, partial [Planctomycetota bacterium]
MLRPATIGSIPLNALFIGLASIAALLAISTGCSHIDSGPKQRLVIWHQMMVGERKILEQQLEAFEQANPGIEVEALYKETEELRSGFQAAALAGIGPDLIYGPSDAIGAFVTMGLLSDLQPYFSATELEEFVDQAVIRVASENGP